MYNNIRREIYYFFFAKKIFTQLNNYLYDKFHEYSIYYVIKIITNHYKQILVLEISNKIPILNL